MLCPSLCWEPCAPAAASAELRARRRHQLVRRRPITALASVLDSHGLDGHNGSDPLPVVWLQTLHEVPAFQLRELPNQCVAGPAASQQREHFPHGRNHRIEQHPVFPDHKLRELAVVSSLSSHGGGSRYLLHRRNPFFGWTLASDVLYTGVLFGLYAWLGRTVATSERVPAAA